MVVHDSESDQELIEERSEVVEIVRQRLMSRSRKTERSAEDFFNEFFDKNNIALED